MATRATIGLVSHRGSSDETVREHAVKAPLNAKQRERALGALIGAATGDALGAPYEFEPPIADSDDVAMVGGGHFNWKPGEWTDDTAMSIVVLKVAAEPELGASLTSEAALDEIAAGWYRWSHETVDIGNLTGEVMLLSHVKAQEHGRQLPNGTDLHEAATELSASREATAGNGGLMRTFSVVLPYLRASEDEFLCAVTKVNSLTHVDPDASNAAILWSFAIRHAILTGELDLLAGLEFIDHTHRERWVTLIEQARTAPPSHFKRNGWVVHAFQAAVAAIAQAGEIPGDKFERRAYLTRVLDGAVRAGYDTDTVASIAGALAGAVLGYKAVDPTWRRILNGWPGYNYQELEELGRRVLDAADRV